MAGTNGGVTRSFTGLDYHVPTHQAEVEYSDDHQTQDGRGSVGQ